MKNSVFFESEFFTLVLCSIAAPLGVYVYLMWQRAISRLSVVSFGLGLVILSSVDVIMLQRLRTLAVATPSVFDDQLFASEFSATLYVLPLFFAGVGVNLASHVMIRHLTEAEDRFEKLFKHPNGKS